MKPPLEKETHDLKHSQKAGRSQKPARPTATKDRIRIRRLSGITDPQKLKSSLVKRRTVAMNCLTHRLSLALGLSLSLFAQLCVAADPIPGIGPKGEVKKVHGSFQFTEGPAADR